MSHEIVKNITITKDKVFINCASNNCRPLSYSNEEYPYFTNILNEKGKEAVEIEIFRNFEEGNLQSSLNNKYTRALKVLFNTFKEEYAKFNWRNHNSKYGSKEREAEENLRKSIDFKELLKKALNTKLPKDIFIITKKYSYNQEIVYAKVCPTCVKWLYDENKATKFNFKEEAERHIYKDFKGIWEVKQLK
jgi:hypothetical protein